MIGELLALVGLWCVRWRRLVLTGWVLISLAGVAAAGVIMDHMDRVPFPAARSEAVVGREHLTASQLYDATVDVLVDGLAASDAATVHTVCAELSAIDGVATVTDPFKGTDPTVIAEDGKAVVVSVGLAKGLSTARQTKVQQQIEGRLDEFDVAEAHVLVGGSLPTQRATRAHTASDTWHAELFTLPLTLVLMCLFFGGVSVAVIPFLSSVAAICAGVIVLLGLSCIRDLNSPTLSIVTILGLGLGIDYSLLQVHRFRDGLTAGSPVPEAVADTMRTAGRTIVFSGLTVVTALLGLCVFPSPFYVSVGLVGAAAVGLSMLVGLTLTPALLATLAGRVHGGSGRRRRPAGENFARAARFSRRFALPVTIGVSALLLAVAAPFLRVHLVDTDAALTLPRSAEEHRFADKIADRFPQQRSDLVYLVARTSPQRLDDWSRELLRGDRDAESVSPAQVPASGTSVVTITPRQGPQGKAAQALVDRIRDHRPAGFTVWVTGDPALERDYVKEISTYTPWAVLVTAAATLILLMGMTRSVLVAVKAVLMNVLSLGASLGTMVLVFQNGYAADILAVPVTGGIQTWTPIVVFAFTFGLSMDYEVFLVARIKELHDAGASSATAVEEGLRSSGRVITSAAILMVIVFAGLAAGTTLAVKQLGLALMLAVLVDATVVRCLLVPATMVLLGEWNWWAPHWLRHWRITPPWFDRAIGRGGAMARRPAPGGFRPTKAEMPLWTGSVPTARLPSDSALEPSRQHRSGRIDPHKPTRFSERGPGF